MVARVALRSDLRALDGYEAFVKNARRASGQLIQLTVQRNINTYLRPMEQINPGPSKHGGKARDWSTNEAAGRKAQKWWFANLREGKVGGGSTGAMMRAWAFTLRKNILSLENTHPGFPYVGSFAQSARARGGRPNPGHIRTGWPQAIRRTGLEVMDTVLSDVQLAYVSSIAASVAAGRFVVQVGGRDVR